MEVAIIKGKSLKSMKALIAIAKELGIEAAFLDKEAQEDMGLLKAMKTGRTHKPVLLSTVMKNLKK